MEAKRPENVHANYHAHVYFGPDTLEHGCWLCATAGEIFGLRVGRIHQKPVGPHPCWSCQLAFSAAEFDALMAWLDKNRNDLTIFVHGLTGDDLADHTTHARWLGAAATLNLDALRGN